MRAKAEPQADGTYMITGNKIFISSGEHDLADNIVHLVLARIIPKSVPQCGSVRHMVPVHSPLTILCK
jgi:alkylation response protein AidB-like acyl-CoA dehydrogenase